MLFDLLCLSAVLGYQLPQDDINHSDLTGRLDPRPRLRRGLRRTLADGPTLGQREWKAAGTRLAGRLTQALRSRDLTAQDADGNFEPLRSLLSFAPSILAVDCVVPEHPIARVAWTTVIKVLGAVHPSKVSRVSLPWIDAARLAALAREARRASRPDCDATGARPGLSGRHLAVDPRLAAAVGRALGESLEPAFIARYVFYGRPGDYFWPHTDSVLVHVNVFICLEHHMPAGASRPSAFVAFRANGRAERFELSAGDAIAAHTQGCVHAREPLQDGERVTLLAIALKPRAVRHLHEAQRTGLIQVGVSRPRGGIRRERCPNRKGRAGVMAKHRIYTTNFSSVYPAYVAKAERKGRTRAEVDQIIIWLTGYSEAQMAAHLRARTDFETFFAKAPRLNPLRTLIKGVVCGIRVEEIEDPTMREIRYLDKLVDELARGKAMEKILRAP